MLSRDAGCKELILLACMVLMGLIMPQTCRLCCCSSSYLLRLTLKAEMFFFSKPFIVTCEIYTAFLLGAESGNSTFHFGVVLARMLEYLLRSSTLITEAAWPVACVQSRKQKIR